MKSKESVNPQRDSVEQIEGGESGIRFSGKYTDKWGRVFGSFESNQLSPLPEPSSNEANYFEGLVKTTYGDFLIECEISEAKRALALIANFINANKELATLRLHLKEAKVRLDYAQRMFREKGAAPDHEASHLVDKLETRERELRIKLEYLIGSLERIGGVIYVE